MRKKLPGCGQFTQLGEKPLVGKSIMIDPYDVDVLDGMRRNGESFGDKVRQAIAFYIEHHPIDTTDIFD